MLLHIMFDIAVILCIYHEICNKEYSTVMYKPLYCATALFLSAGQSIGLFCFSDAALYMRACTCVC